MNWMDAVRGGLIAALCAAGGAIAQPAVGTMTDVGLAPAEDRDSAGAVQMDTKYVRPARPAIPKGPTPQEVQASLRQVAPTLFAGQPDTRQLGGPPETEPADEPDSQPAPVREPAPEPLTKQ